MIKRLRGMAGLAILSMAGVAPASAAAEKFGLEYRVERADAGKLSLATCLRTAEQASASIGYVTANRQVFPNQLAVFASGPARVADH